ncbi:MAG: hypothetical protein WD737_08415 [Gemmatimonadota bacterium]
MTTNCLLDISIRRLKSSVTLCGAGHDSGLVAFETMQEVLGSSGGMLGSAGPRGMPAPAASTRVGLDSG